MPRRYEYGREPEVFWTTFTPDWTEYMRWLYLPVVMKGVWVTRPQLPPNLEFLRPLVNEVIFREEIRMMNPHAYIYVSAHRGYATPENPLNRPGWHSDGFGSDDVNYVWADRFPTRFALGPFEAISDDHVVSAQQFAAQIEWSPDAIRVVEGQPNTVYRLDPSVVHTTPDVPAPGGERSFIKVSVSPSRYNLLGNSHNHLFDYDWQMYSRAELRNDPAYAGGDAGPQEVADALV